MVRRDSVEHRRANSTGPPVPFLERAVPDGELVGKHYEGSVDPDALPLTDLFPDQVDVVFCNTCRQPIAVDDGSGDFYCFRCPKGCGIPRSLVHIKPYAALEDDGRSSIC